MVPLCRAAETACGNSPRIRGDGPLDTLDWESSPEFSPYSRGWSPHADRRAVWRVILPVFAGMVPVRGLHTDINPEFSPYSRGWSRWPCGGHSRACILPVFAGMVPKAAYSTRYRTDSPRIRGDGPDAPTETGSYLKFSPYSRGWSLPASG